MQRTRQDDPQKRDQLLVSLTQVQQLPRHVVFLWVHNIGESMGREVSAVELEIDHLEILPPPTDIVLTCAFTSPTTTPTSTLAKQIKARLTEKNVRSSSITSISRGGLTHTAASISIRSFEYDSC
jgi:hypothetical protein